MNLSNIQEHGKGLLVDVTHQGKRTRIACATIDEAMDVKRKLKNKVRLVADPAGWSIGKAFEQVCATPAIGGGWKGSKSESGSVYNAKCAVDFFGKDTLLDDITPEWAQAYVARLAQLGNTGGTINRKRAALSKLFTYAIDLHKCQRKVKVQRQKEHEQDIRFLTQPEEKRCLDQLSHWGKDEEAEVFCVLVDTGLREGELWKLVPADCDFEQGLIRIRDPKNSSTRYVPMVTRVREILTRRCELATKKDRLFPYNNGWLTRIWARLKFAMDLVDDELFTPYALRKTCASRLVQRGVPLAVVQVWMGHKTPQVTMRYAKLQPKNLFDAAKVLEAC